jgi:hypothetical protein
MRIMCSLIFSLIVPIGPSDGELPWLEGVCDAKGCNAAMPRSIAKEQRTTQASQNRLPYSLP